MYVGLLMEELLNGIVKRNWALSGVTRPLSRHAVAAAAAAAVVAAAAVLFVCCPDAWKRVPVRAGRVING